MRLFLRLKIVFTIQPHSKNMKQNTTFIIIGAAALVAGLILEKKFALSAKIPVLKSL